MGWGMLHAAGLGAGGLADHYSDLSASTHLHQHEPQLMLHQTSLPLHQSQHQNSCQEQHAEMFNDRCEEDLLASLLQVSGQLEDSVTSVQDTDCSSSGDSHRLPCLGSPGSSAGSLPSHATGTSVPPFGRINSVAATRSHLIKEGLRLTIQSRRRDKGQEDVRPDEDATTGEIQSCEELTEEDEERRKRRRERNKVAATKCRNKKKERTQRLAVESTCLESNNQFLKEEIRRLEVERQELLDLLQNHGPICPIQQQQRAQQQLQRPEDHHHMHYMEGH